MRCCDCEFRKDCKEVENDLVSFALCSTRITLLSEKHLANKLSRIAQIDKLKASYGFDFPMKAKFKRNENTIYTIMDFADGEEIEFYGMCEKPSSCALGYADYMSEDKGIRLTKIDDLLPTGAEIITNA